MVECAAAILTEIPLKRTVAAVLDRLVRTTARALGTITPANLFEQVRFERFQAKHIERDHLCWAPCQRALALFDSSAFAELYQQSLIDERCCKECVPESNEI